MTEKTLDYLCYIKDNIDKNNQEIAKGLGRHPSVVSQVLKKCNVTKDLNSIERYLAKHRKTSKGLNGKKTPLASVGIQLPPSKIQSTKTTRGLKNFRKGWHLRKDVVDSLMFIANNLNLANIEISKKLKVNINYVGQTLKRYDLPREKDAILNFLADNANMPIVETQAIESVSTQVDRPVKIENREDDSKSMPDADWTLITPLKAQVMLDKNKGNRRYTQSVVDTYAMEMTRGNWEERTGEPLKFDVKGNLIDGQHRLMAIVKSGKSFHFLIIRDLPTKAFQVIDTGRNRTAGDVLSIEKKFQHPSHIAAMAKFIIGFKNGRYNAAAQGKVKGNTANKITNADVLSFANKNKEELLESYEYGFCKENNVLNGAFLSGLHFIFNEIDSSDADDFCHRLAIGDKLAKDSPIMLLRQTLINDKNSQRKMKAIVKIAVVCKAWNLYRKNEKTGHLKFMLGKESFPKPI